MLYERRDIEASASRHYVRSSPTLSLLPLTSLQTTSLKNLQQSPRRGPCQSPGAHLSLFHSSNLSYLPFFLLGRLLSKFFRDFSPFTNIRQCLTRLALYDGFRRLHISSPPSRLPHTYLPGRTMPSQLEITPHLAAALALTNQYRIYVIFGDTVGRVENKWARRYYSSAAEVWTAVHQVSVDVLETSWYFNEPERLRDYRRRQQALRILGCALEAAGDTSCKRFRRQLLD
ncbi:hypothetical protein C8F04DRAFT_1272083 [Mycena alexandri]|uniref:Uncharacterized protein n=1 Tax=Mycena alexandri TaxID=1745969 RepID=A0AAD6S8L7_9AGAR|nr:hypothetical protein C8F04DRAFT_1272083 [Mycena alexandri]